MIRSILSKFKFLLPLYCCVRPYACKAFFFSAFLKRKGPRQMIVCEDDFCVMGGLCDRLNGIVSMYKYCKNYGIPFKINFIKPFDLNDYLNPNLYNWMIDSQTIDYIHSHKKYIPMMDMKWDSFEDYFTTQTKYVNNLMKSWKSGTLICWSNAHLVRKNEFANLFEELFKPTKIIQDQILHNSKRIGGDYIGVTIRFQNLLGDFKEGNIKELELSKKNSLMKRCEQKTIEIHNQNPGLKILLTSDSRLFLDYMEKYDFIYIIPGKLIHMEYIIEKGIESYIKGFMDLLMLSKAKKLYLLITDNMWRSSFSETASYIGNCEYYDIRF